MNVYNTKMWHINLRIHIIPFHIDDISIEEIDSFYPYWEEKEPILCDGKQYQESRQSAYIYKKYS